MIWLGEEERFELEWLRGELRPGDVFVDCGANLGLWSLTAAPAVAPKGKVVAFEPNPSIALRLEEEHCLQAGDIIETHSVALSDNPGTSAFDTSDRHNTARLASDGDLSVPVMD